jgi:hypothetical protein
MLILTYQKILLILFIYINFIKNCFIKIIYYYHIHHFHLIYLHHLIKKTHIVVMTLNLLQIYHPLFIHCLYTHWYVTLKILTNLQNQDHI